MFLPGHSIALNHLCLSPFPIPQPLPPAPLLGLPLAEHSQLVPHASSRFPLGSPQASQHQEPLLAVEGAQTIPTLRWDCLGPPGGISPLLVLQYSSSQGSRWWGSLTPPPSSRSLVPSGQRLPGHPQSQRGRASAPASKLGAWSVLRPLLPCISLGAPAAVRGQHLELLEEWSSQQRCIGLPGKRSANLQSIFFLRVQESG